MASLQVAVKGDPSSKILLDVSSPAVLCSNQLHTSSTYPGSAGRQQAEVDVDMFGSFELH